jgi:uncharacterized protein
MHVLPRAHPTNRPTPEAIAVKFQPDRLDGVNAITAYTADSLSVNAQTWRQSIVVPHQGETQAWPCTRFDELDESHFESLLALQPELLIIGTGRAHRFVSPALTRSLIARRIGVECMDTRAACRTYNILVSEGRKVVAALLLD